MSTEHALWIYCDFVLRSEWSLINIPGTVGVGPNKLLVVKELIQRHKRSFVRSHNQQYALPFDNLPPLPPL